MEWIKSIKFLQLLKLLKRQDKMSYTLEFDDIDYDRGFGMEYGTLQLEVTPVFTDETFDAYNYGGTLQVYGDSEALTGFTIEGGSLFLINNDGGEYCEIPMETEEILELVDYDTILESLIRRHY